MTPLSIFQGSFSIKYENVTVWQLTIIPLEECSNEDIWVRLNDPFPGREMERGRKAIAKLGSDFA